jgi:hypothetical protein
MKWVMGSISAIGFASVLLVQCSHDAQDRTPDQVNAENGHDRSARLERRAPPRLVRSPQMDPAQAPDESKAEPRGASEGRFIGGGPRESTSGASNASAIMSVAAARCDREARCDRVGGGEKYGTRRDCLSDVRRDDRLDLTGDACPGGISAKGLDGCLQSIRSEDCSNPLTTVTRLTACRAGNLCLR